MPAPFSVAARRAIVAELVRLTLGGRGPARAELLAPIRDDRIQHTQKRPRKVRA